MPLLCCVSLNSPLVHWCGTRQDYTRYSNTVEGITSFTLLEFEERCARAPFRHDSHLNKYEPKYIHPYSSPAHAATDLRLCCVDYSRLAAWARAHACFYVRVIKRAYVVIIERVEEGK